MGKGAAVLALVTAALLTAACGSSSNALQAILEQHHQLQLTPLAPHATSISAHEAEDLASSFMVWTTPPRKRPRLSNAGLWRVKDPELYIPEHGIHRLLVNNQVDWVVLVHGVNVAGAPTPSGATGANGPAGETPQWKPLYGTVAIAINAESGRTVDYWLLP